MTRYLIVIVGYNYLQPMIVVGDIDYIIKNLGNESNNNEYIYSIYKYNENYDVYYSYGVIHHGCFSDKEGYRIDGIRVAR